LCVEAVDVAAMLDNFMTIPLAQEPSETVVNTAGDVDLFAR
jgi:hypothetical protein